MKKTLTLYFTLLAALSYGQNTGAHQPEAPPQNIGPFVRAMFVDCSNEIILDLVNHNALGKYDQLKDFIRTNFIGTIILQGLEQGVFGNSQQEAQLRYMLADLHTNFPDIKIGAYAGTPSAFSTSFVRVSDYIQRSCFPNIFASSARSADSLINASTSFQARKQKELMRFFLNAVSLSRCRSERASDKCRSAFDILYLDYPYWQTAGSISLADEKAEFEVFKNTLRLMQSLKCNYSCISSVEATFNPTDYYRLQGWTSTDQITEADPLIDKMMIPAYSSYLSPSTGYDNSCRLLHLLSDQFSTNGSRFYIGLSAKSLSYNYCNTAMIPEEHLGEYLDGTASINGNMYSIEKFYTDKLSDPNYFCGSCSCYAFNDNQYSSLNQTANRCIGSLWTSYTLMNDHAITRSLKETGTNQFSVSFNSHQLKVKAEIETEGKVTVYDMSGKECYSANVHIGIENEYTLPEIKAGLYIVEIKTLKENFHRLTPVLYR